MTRIAFLLIAALLTSCGAPETPSLPPPLAVAEPLPTPPVPPPAAKIPPGAVALRAAYADAARRLREYLALGPCLPSGPLACVDKDQVLVANEAQRVAHDALVAAERRAAAVHVAALRVAAFQAVMDNLGQ